MLSERSVMIAMAVSMSGQETAESTFVEADREFIILATSLGPK